jgi:Fur family transcriptional regulator, ferric uptake regulator
VSASGWVQRAEATLAASGRRRGGARRAVLELLDSQRCALTALEIEQALRESRPRGVSRASIYRILDQLERLALLRRVQTGQAMVRHEPVREGPAHHHHLVCQSCGAVEPFSDPALEREIDRLSDRVPLAVAEHEIVLRGTCAQCHGP